MSLLDDLKYKFTTGDVIIKLIYINVAVFIAMFIFKLLGIDLQAHLSALPTLQNFYKQPWGIFTYMFLHSPKSFVFHLLINMFMLYTVGQLFLRYFREKDLLTFYLFGGITGGIIFTIASTYFNINGNLVGASAAIYALFFALVAYSPKMKIQLMFFNTTIPLDYIAYAFLGLDLFMILSNNNVGGSVSHLGGALFGFLYMKQFEKGNDFLGKAISNITSIKIKPSKPKQSYQKTNVPRDDYDFNAIKLKNQQKIDSILDKISRSGYDSLSKHEKDFLFKSGK